MYIFMYIYIYIYGVCVCVVCVSVCVYVCVFKAVAIALWRLGRYSEKRLAVKSISRVLCTDIASRAENRCLIGS